MSEAQKSPGEDRDGIFKVGDAGELAVEFTVNVVGEILVSDLCKLEERVKCSSFPI